MGGGLIKDNNKWRTTNFNDSGDNFGLSGDRLRVIAAGLLYKNKQAQLVIVSGGKGQLKNVLPGKLTLASVIKSELVKIGVPAKNIIKEEKSGNTYEQLKEIQKIINNKNFKKIVIISNKHHLPRLKAMIEYLGELRPLKEMTASLRLKIKSAESVVLKYEPTIWREVIDGVRESAAMKQRIKLEKQGVAQIKKGIYKFK